MTKKLSCTHILARNLKMAMDRDPEKYSRTKLAKAAKVAPNTISYMLDPDRRIDTRKASPSPRLSLVEKIAAALEIDVWELMHPDYPVTCVTEKERKLWKEIEAGFNQLTQLHEKQPAPYLPAQPLSD